MLSTPAAHTGKILSQTRIIITSAALVFVSALVPGSSSMPISCAGGGGSFSWRWRLLYVKIDFLSLLKLLAMNPLSPIHFMSVLLPDAYLSTSFLFHSVRSVRIHIEMVGENLSFTFICASSRNQTPNASGEELIWRQCMNTHRLCRVNFFVFTNPASDGTLVLSG